MNEKVQLKFTSVFPGFKSAITSIERFEHIINNYSFWAENLPKRVTCKPLDKNPFLAKIGPIYLQEVSGSRYGKIIEVDGSDDELISKNPLAFVYTDGGLEYLSGFTGEEDEPFYVCNLIVPSINTLLQYSHKIKDPELITRVKRRSLSKL